MRRWMFLAIGIALSACGEKAIKQPAALGGNPDRGRQLVNQYNCTACHSIPGIEGPKGMVGPPLDHIAVRQVIGGKVPNNPQTMSKWLQNPQAFDPGNAMPNLGINQADARDLTAFLYTLK